MYYVHAKNIRRNLHLTAVPAETAPKPPRAAKHSTVGRFSKSFFLMDIYHLLRRSRAYWTIKTAEGGILLVLIKRNISYIIYLIVGKFLYVYEYVRTYI